MEVREKEGNDLLVIIEKVLAAEKRDIKHDLELNRLERERRSYKYIVIYKCYLQVVHFQNLIIVVNAQCLQGIRMRIVLNISHLSYL